MAGQRPANYNTDASFAGLLVDPEIDRVDDRVDRASLKLSQPIKGHKVDFFRPLIIHFRRRPGVGQGLYQGWKMASKKPRFFSGF